MKATSGRTNRQSWLFPSPRPTHSPYYRCRKLITVRLFIKLYTRCGPIDGATLHSVRPKYGFLRSTLPKPNTYFNNPGMSFHERYDSSPVTASCGDRGSSPTWRPRPSTAATAPPSRRERSTSSPTARSSNPTASPTWELQRFHPRPLSGIHAPYLLYWLAPGYPTWRRTNDSPDPRASTPQRTTGQNPAPPDSPLSLCYHCTLIKGRFIKKKKSYYCGMIIH